MGECMEWVKALPKLEESSPGSVLPAFRLWVTAEPHNEFPIGMLQLSIKFTNEAPAGIMLGVRNTYTWLNQDMLDSVTDPKWKTMLFALAFMHTIVQVRVGCAHHERTPIVPRAASLTCFRSMWSCTGAAEIRPARLQHLVRILAGRPLGVRHLHAEPPEHDGD